MDAFIPILVVIPSLGLRPEALLRNIKHLREVENARVVVVGPQRARKIILELLGDKIQFIEERGGGGPAAAINQGLDFFRGRFEVFTWLGDDDWVVPEGFSNLARRLMLADDTVVVGMGDVFYSDSNGKLFRTHHQPRFPKFSLKYGPQKIAQPGLLFKASLLTHISLDDSFLCAWDQDFIDRAALMGLFLRIRGVVSNYTWGEGTLTSSYLETSMIESALIRLRSKARKQFWTNLESIRIVASLTLGTRLSSPSRSVNKALPTYSRIKSSLLEGSRN